jgi:hypothetical protein
MYRAQLARRKKKKAERLWRTKRYMKGTFQVFSLLCQLGSHRFELTHVR